MRWDGREPALSDTITTLGIIKLLLAYFSRFAKVSSTKDYYSLIIGRPAKVYPVSPSHLTVGPPRTRLALNNVPRIPGTLYYMCTCILCIHLNRLVACRTNRFQCSTAVSTGPASILPRVAGVWIA